MTREEAIKVVRNIYQTDAEKEALETLIPELKESDDERVIKKLQEYVKNRNWVLNGPTQAEVLAWLEKQKNLISYYEEKLDRCACENLDKGIKEVLNHPEEYGLEKQKEQKPAEWGEEDEKMLNDILGILHSTEDVALANFSEQKKWLKSLRPVKQEWSEEDEENFKWFDKFFRAESIMIGGKEIPQDKYLWFKSLRPQPKQSGVRKIRN